MSVLRTSVLGLLAGCGVYAVADVIGDYSTYRILRDEALQLAQSRDDIKEQLGEPFSPGAWYNASIGFSQQAQVAQCSFQLHGSRQATDIKVRAVRRPGPLGLALYNLTGPGDWRLTECHAMFPSGGGRVEPRSLLPVLAVSQQEQAQPPPPGQQPGGSSGAGAQPGSSKGGSGGTAAAVAPGGGPQAAADGAGAQKGAGGRRWWWPFQRRSSSAAEP